MQYTLTYTKKSRDALIHEISESCKEIKIEMPSDDLVELRKFLTDNGIESETLEEVSPGYRREPTIIAIIVTAMPLAFSLLKEWLGSRHEEKITKTKLVAQLAGVGTQPMSLEKLESVSKIMSEKA